MQVQLETPLNVLNEIFGFAEFRPMQEEIIDSLLDGNDCQVIMPTGGGKSLCYQIPALLMPHLTIVVSPLIALMDDQVLALKELGVNAAAIHSNLDPSEKVKIIDQIESGSLKLLYMAPESLLQERMVAYLKRMKVSLFAIDEAHCISVWGNEFRPEYTKLAKLKELYPETPMIALTATADATTRADILEQLSMDEAKCFISSFERPNLTVRAFPGQDRMKKILPFLRQRPGQSGIIYCLSRKNTETVSARLRNEGISADFYHAGMGAKDRREVQKKFQNDEINVICATIAFGMGIDKSNVRFVIHYNMPKTIESYYQEIGRSGRDGLPAETILFYSWRDVSMLQYFIVSSEANEEFKSIQMAKLDRMWEYATASSCRTNLILSYFGEFKSSGCGHCDNCINPPKLIDGTKLTQMALSAVVRTKENIGINTLIDILRGSVKNEIRIAGYDRIKTYGVGRQYTYLEWKSYITQIINQGGLSIDYKEKGKLKLTPLSKDFLSGNIPSQLAKFSYVEKTQKEEPSPTFAYDELFEKLKSWRLQISKEKSIPAYTILNDFTLKELSAVKPVLRSDLTSIEGIGPVKMEQYGDQIIKIIRNYVRQAGKKNVKGKTHLETLNLYREGKSVEEIALIRTINPDTVVNHLTKLIESDEMIDVSDILSFKTRKIILDRWNNLGKPEKIKGLYESLGENYSYAIIRLAIATDRLKMKN
jgi:ATP-dependent DNA helicase RecQ